MAAPAPAGMIFSGGPASVHVEARPRIDPAVYDLGVPILGICYGAQLWRCDLGGEVAKTGRGEYGRTELTRADGGACLFGPAQPSLQPVWMSHFDTITAAPGGFAVTASTPDTPAAAFEAPSGGIYGVQFHPEVAHTPHGQELLEQFVYEACGCRPTWTMSSIIESSIDGDPGPGGRRAGPSAGSRAASTRRWPPRWCTAPSAPSSRACSSTPG